MGPTFSLPKACASSSTKTLSLSSSSSSSLIYAKLDLGVEVNVSTKVDGRGQYVFFSGVVCVPEAKRRFVGGGAFAIAGRGGVGNGCLGKTFCKKSAIACICVMRLNSSSLIF